jgi:hypothetical protein
MIWSGDCYAVGRLLGRPFWVAIVGAAWQLFSMFESATVKLFNRHFPL